MVDYTLFDDLEGSGPIARAKVAHRMATAVHNRAIEEAAKVAAAYDFDEDPERIAEQIRKLLRAP
jgi:hypothetical protein